MEMGGDRNFLSFIEKYYNYNVFSDYFAFYWPIKRLKKYNFKEVPFPFLNIYLFDAKNFDETNLNFSKIYDARTLDKIKRSAKIYIRVSFEISTKSHKGVAVRGTPTVHFSGNLQGGCVYGTEKGIFQCSLTKSHLLSFNRRKIGF